MNDNDNVKTVPVTPELQTLLDTHGNIAGVMEYITSLEKKYKMLEDDYRGLVSENLQLLACGYFEF